MSDAANAGVLEYELTGNHYIALPCIRLSDGAVDRVNVLHARHGGLLEWAGAYPPSQERPLLRPVFRIGGSEVTLEEVAWEQVDRWIPQFRGRLGDVAMVTGTWVAPGAPEGSHRGAALRLEFQSNSREPIQLEVGLAGTWAASTKTIRTGRLLPGRNSLWFAGTPPGIVLEQDGGNGAALALTTTGAATYTAGRGDEEPRALQAGDELGADNGQPIRFGVFRSITLDPRARANIAFFLGVGPERDGALAAARYLGRIGSGELLRETRLALARVHRRVRDSALTRLLNRNLLFNFFYAVGRAIDDDRLHALASRSPLLPGAATFRERDALLWSLPALTLVDPPTAREVLLQSFERFSHLPGQASRYLDGNVLEPGLGLDQCCAYVIALDRYVADTGDATPMDEPIVRQVMGELEDLLFSRLHPEIFLCSTELAPSGDPPDFPYVTYDNVLVYAVCRILDRIRPHGDGAAPGRLEGGADEVASAIWRYATADVDGLRVLVFSTDLAGESAIYDDPAGSLQLLPYFDFCAADDPIWRDTVELLRSDRNPLWIGDAPFPGAAARHDARRAALAALCSDLLGSRRDEALEILRRIPLDRGLAGETYDPASGLVASGRHYAALAGFLSWALWQAVGS